MPRSHALELLPDEAGCHAVRRDWQALHDAGLPSQLDHTGSTNTPHVTVVAAPGLTAAHEAAASTLLGPLLPTAVRASGLAVLGGDRVTLARLLDVPDDLVSAVLALRSEVPLAQHPGWLPHLTLARRLLRSDVPAALDVLGHEDVVLRLASLRRWDPEAEEVRDLVSAG